MSFVPPLSIKVKSLDCHITSMHIVIFSHPEYLNIRSISKYVQMLSQGLRERGHQVEVLIPKTKLYRLSSNRTTIKWLGYLEQYIIFPIVIRRKLSRIPKNALFVFADNAQGPWVPLVRNRPHVIHCHDFLAQCSALDEIPEHKTGLSGRLYQKFIRQGYSKGKNFISISHKTKADLDRLLASNPTISEVVYNGLSQNFSLLPPLKARRSFSEKFGIDLTGGYILHVGNNAWYKNRIGVIDIYNRYRSDGGQILPLVLVGTKPSKEIFQVYFNSPYKNDIHWISDIEDEYMNVAYAGATIFLFPSLAEGFGWPIAEAMASGCPVITTSEAPMTEVAGKAAIYIAKRPNNETDIATWAQQSALTLKMALDLHPSEREKLIRKGTENAKRFDTQLALEKIESIYKTVFKEQTWATSSF